LASIRVSSTIAIVIAIANGIPLTIAVHVHMVYIYVWPDDGSLTEPKHVATLKSVVLDEYCCTIYCDILQQNEIENIKKFNVY
jgi:hypothetical protein